MNTLGEFLAPHWAALLLLRTIVMDFFQTLLLEQINDQPPPSERIYARRIVSKVSLRCLVKGFDVENPGEHFKV